MQIFFNQFLPFGVSQKEVLFIYKQKLFSISINFSFFYKRTKNSQKVAWQFFPEGTHFQKYVAKIRYFNSLFHNMILKTVS